MSAKPAFADDPARPNAARPLRLDRRPQPLFAHRGTHPRLTHEASPVDRLQRHRSQPSPASTANTAWYFDKQFCGLTHPLAWNDAPILAIDTVNYVQGAAAAWRQKHRPPPSSFARIGSERFAGSSTSKKSRVTFLHPDLPRITSVIDEGMTSCHPSGNRWRTTRSSNKFAETKRQKCSRSRGLKGSPRSLEPTAEPKSKCS